ncbi:MAG: PASTA domain-containing protein [Bacteroidetes bacterium]|nr:PASTA domain-containing protein [Bacteroidota bacterium]
MKKLFKNRPKWMIIGINMLIAIVVFLIFIWGLQKWMYDFTHHGEAVEVPNLVGVRMDKAIAMLEEGKFRYEIIDSVYRDSMKKMDIVEQDPSGGSFVKKGRKVYLIVNSLDKPKVQVPKLINKSLNLATALLRNSGLRVGNIETKKTLLGDNLVLAQLYHGDTIKPYTMVYKGTAIDLIVSIKPDEGDQFDENGNYILPEETVIEENNN